MFGGRVTLFRLLGFEVRIDASWIFLAALVTWSLAVGLFPHYYPGLPSMTYWWMGVFGAIGLFASIVFHELSHSIVARRFGIPMKGITLFIFGGVAEMTEEPPSARAEFFMAVIGPVSSLFVAGVCYVLYRTGEAAFPVPVTGVLHYLGLINGVLAAFNLIPAFPLDGGRVLRSLLWAWKKNLRWATRIASQAGSAFAVLLIVLGAVRFFMGDFIGGLWWFMIGMFLNNAARMSYRQVLTRKALEGEKVRDFMVSRPITVSPDITLDELVRDYVYRYHFQMFPVVSGGRLGGCITVRHVKETDREKWGQVRVGEVVAGCSQENTIGPEEDAVRALSAMSRTGNSRLMVVEGDELVGIITLKDLLRFLSLKVELKDL